MVSYICPDFLIDLRHAAIYRLISLGFGGQRKQDEDMEHRIGVFFSISTIVLVAT
jgi:hypothetical protein